MGLLALLLFGGLMVAAISIDTEPTDTDSRESL